MSELPGGTLTVLHTEIEGSTLLTVHLGDRYPEVLATHCALLRAAFTAHEGHEIDTQGDSFFVVFSRATQAVAAAVLLPRAVLIAELSQTRKAGVYGVRESAKLAQVGTVEYYYGCSHIDMEQDRGQTNTLQHRKGSYASRHGQRSHVPGTTRADGHYLH